MGGSGCTLFRTRPRLRETVQVTPILSQIPIAHPGRGAQIEGGSTGWDPGMDVVHKPKHAGLNLKVEAVVIALRQSPAGQCIGDALGGFEGLLRGASQWDGFEMKFRARVGGADAIGAIRALAGKRGGGQGVAVEEANAPDDREEKSETECDVSLGWTRHAGERMGCVRSKQSANVGCSHEIVGINQLFVLLALTFN